MLEAAAVFLGPARARFALIGEFNASTLILGCAPRLRRVGAPPLDRGTLRTPTVAERKKTPRGRISRCAGPAPPLRGPTSPNCPTESPG